MLFLLNSATREPQEEKPLKNGIIFGMGALLGWFLLRWSILFLFSIVFSMCICSVVLDHERNPSPIHVSTPTPSTKKRTHVQFNANCNLRANHTIQSEILTVLPKNKTFTVLDQWNNWRKVNYSGKTGWAGCTFH